MPEWAGAERRLGRVRALDRDECDALGGPVAVCDVAARGDRPNEEIHAHQEQGNVEDRLQRRGDTGLAGTADTVQQDDRSRFPLHRPEPS